MKKYIPTFESFVRDSFTSFHKLNFKSEKITFKILDNKLSKIIKDSKFRNDIEYSRKDGIKHYSLNKLDFDLFIDWANQLKFDVDPESKNCAIELLMPF